MSNKTSLVQVPVTDEEKKRIRQYAVDNDISVPEVIRRAVAVLLGDLPITLFRKDDPKPVLDNGLIPITDEEREVTRRYMEILAQPEELDFESYPIDSWWQFPNSEMILRVDGIASDRVVFKQYNLNRIPSMHIEEDRATKKILNRFHREMSLSWDECSQLVRLPD